MPNKNKRGEKPNVTPSVPTRFRCKIGGEWKPLDAFSNSQRRFIQQQIDNRQNVNAANCGMTCREHASKTRSEIRCERCKLIKHIDQFSKSSRRNEVYECMRCVAWTETQEPGVTPAPLETGHISVEEQNNEVWQRRFIDAGDLFEEDALPAAPVSGLSALGIDDNEMVASSDSDGNLNISEMLSSASLRKVPGSTAPSVSGESTTSRVTGQASLPPHLASRYPEIPSSASSTYSEALKENRKPSGAHSDAGSLPPHLRQRGAAQPRRKMADSEASDTASIANESTSDDSAADCSEAGLRERRSAFAGLGFRASQIAPRSYANSLSTATTVREERERAAQARRVPYNAWDAKGKLHHGVKEPTVVSSSASTTSTEQRIDNGFVQHVGWDSNDNVVVEQPKYRGKYKWPKASESRLPPGQARPQPRVTHISARHMDPEIDRQRRMNYCDSDDSDY